MQRDLGNEVIVAIAAVGILAFAITFAIILSLSNTPAASVTPTTTSNTGGVTQASTAVAVVSTTAAPTEDTIATLTSIAATVQQALTAKPTQSLVIQETVAPIQTEVATETVVVTSVPINVATETVVVTLTKTNVPTEAVVVTSPPTKAATEQVVTQAVVTQTQPTAAIPTNEPDTTRNSTNVPMPTSVNTAQAQNKPSATPTPRKPTPTSSFTATATATNSATPSLLPPTNTPTRIPSKTPTPTPTPTLTRTPRPTETSGIRPTPTLVQTEAAIIPTMSPNGGCVPPQGWVVYVVRHGDTLFKIAQAVSSSLYELQTANCLTNINNIIAGMTIYVPRLPATTNYPIPATGSPVATGQLQPEGCTDPNSIITNLQPGQIISGVFNVMGTANLPDFWYYKLEVRPDFATIYNFYSRSELAIQDGSLGQIDQSIFGTGIHWIKLTVIGKTDGATPCAIPVIFQ